MEGREIIAYETQEERMERLYEEQEERIDQAWQRLYDWLKPRLSDDDFRTFDQLLTDISMEEQPIN